MPHSPADVTSAKQPQFVRREVASNVWWTRTKYPGLPSFSRHDLKPIVLETEEAVGQAMLAELEELARTKEGDLSIALLGGRGAQHLHRLLGERAKSGHDTLIARLHVFTQDALVPLNMDNSLSFVRDFERLMGKEFFQQVKSFTTFNTAADDIEAEVVRFSRQLEDVGGLDIFFLGHGPEPEDASHLAYIRAGSGATAQDVAGIIPISQTLLEHHIGKFKAGGTEVSPADEAVCRKARFVWTLGPAVILGARKIIQSVVDASTATAKQRTYPRVMNTELSSDDSELAKQLDENPGLWIRLHPNVKSFILPDVPLMDTSVKRQRMEGSLQ